MISVTTENMHRLAAQLRFDVEAELGHSLPVGAIYPSVQHGEARIVVNAEKCSESALKILLRQSQETEDKDQ